MFHMQMYLEIQLCVPQCTLILLTHLPEEKVVLQQPRYALIFGRIGVIYHNPQVSKEEQIKLIDSFMYEMFNKYNISCLTLINTGS